MPPIFPLTFSFGVVVAPWFLVGVLQRFFPPGGFLLQFVEVGLPPLWRWRAWMAESSRPVHSSGRLPSACSSLSSSPLALHGVVSTSPVCLSRAPAFRQVRVVMLAEGSVESPSVLVLAFHSSLFLVEGSSDGSVPGDRSSPLDGCVYSLRFRLSSVASVLSLLGSWAFLPPLSVSLLSDTVAPFLEETVRSSRRFYVFQSSTWWSSVGLSSYTFLGVLAGFWSGFSLSRVVLHRSGRLLASGFSGLVAALPGNSGCALRRSLAVGRAVVSLHPVSSRSAGHFGSDRTVSPLPHYCWSRVHGHASAGLLC